MVATEDIGGREDTSAANAAALPVARAMEAFFTSLQADGMDMGGFRPSGLAAGQVALFMDWENIHLGLNEVKRSPNISAVMEEAQGIGKVAIARAYADFSYSAMQSVPESLYRVGVEPIYVFGRQQGAAQKNSVDMKLAADCMDVCYRHPEIDTFILATGDGDFIHLVNALKPHGKTVIIITLSWAASKRLLGSADRVIFYDKEIDPVDGGGEPPAINEPKVDVTEAMVFSTIAQIVGEQQGEPIMISALKQTVEGRIANFDGVMERMGYKRFRDVTRAAERAGHIVIEVNGMVQWARAAHLEPDEARRLAIGKAPPDYRSDEPKEEKLRLVIRFMDNLERTKPYITFGYLVDTLMREPWAVTAGYERIDMQNLVDAAVNDYGMFTKGNYDRFDEFQRRMVDIPTIMLDRQSDRVQKYLLA